MGSPTSVTAAAGEMRGGDGSGLLTLPPTAATAPKFFFLGAQILLDLVADARPVPRAAERSTTAQRREWQFEASMLDVDDDDNEQQQLEREPLASRLSDDDYRAILHKCSYQTCQAALLVDHRLSRLAIEALRSHKRRHTQSYTGVGRGGGPKYLAEPPTQMLWHADKLGGGITVDHERRVASRVAGSDGGWACQILDRWLSKETTTIALCCETLGLGAEIGLVGRNYYPGSWDAPLSESRHAVVIDAKTGHVHRKGKETMLTLPDAAVAANVAESFRRRLRGGIEGGQRRGRSAAVVPSGALLQLVVDMRHRELTVQLMAREAPGEEPTIVSSVTIEELPAEVAVAVSFGPGEHAVRVLGSSTEEPDGRATSNHVALWDECNVVPPIPMHSHTGSDRQKMHKAVLDAASSWRSDCRDNFGESGTLARVRGTLPAITGASGGAAF